MSADAENVQPEPRVSQSQSGEHTRKNDRYETFEAIFLVPEHYSRLAKVWRTWPAAASGAVEKTELGIRGRSDKKVLVLNKRGQEPSGHLSSFEFGRAKPGG